MQPGVVRETVRQRGIRPRQAVRRVEARIHRAKLLKLLPTVADVLGRVSAEEIVIAYGDEQRLWSEGIEQIPAVEAQGAGAREVLFGIVSRAGRIEIGAGHILGIAAAYSGRSETVVHGCEEHGDSGAAGLAGRGKALRIDQRMRRQYIEATHGIPHLHTRDAIAHQQHLLARHGVLVVGRAKAAGAAARIRIVNALALAHRIEGQDQVAQFREPLAAALIGVAGFAVARVAHLKQHSWEGRPRVGGDIEIGRDVEVGDALVYQLFDSVSGAIEGAHRASVQRSALRHAASQFPEGLAGPFLPLANGLDGSEPGDFAIALLVGALRQIPQEVREAASVLAVSYARERGLGRTLSLGERHGSGQRERHSE
jgi:hypothetical protein